MLIRSWSLFNILGEVELDRINGFGFPLYWISPCKSIYDCIDVCVTIFLHSIPCLSCFIPIDDIHHYILWNCVHILDQILNRLSKDLIVITCNKKIIHLYVHNYIFTYPYFYINSWLASCCFEYHICQ